MSPAVNTAEDRATARGSDHSGGASAQRSMPLSAPTALAVELDGTGIEEAVAGGKAASLDRLIGWGFPVPRVGVVTTGAYRRFVRAAGIDAELDACAELEADALEPDRITALFLAPPMPADLLAAIAEVCRRVADCDDATWASGRPTFAVRSSASAEDQAGASFAGQYDSVLDVPAEAVVDAVRQVWASLWTPAAHAYRLSHGIDEHDLAMAVVIMPLVSPDHAGVVFTLDPGGVGGHARVEVVEGLAEGLVSGSDTPDAWIVPRDSPRRLPGESGALLDPLLDLALAVEASMGTPVDVEWVERDGVIQLVQARPITVAVDAAEDDDGFDTPPLPGATYTPAGISEMLPGVLPPLLWTSNGALLEEGFRCLFDDLGLMPERIEAAHGVVGRFRGRAAMNLTLLREVAASMPGGSGEEMERQYFGRTLSSGDDAADDHPDVESGERSGAIASLRSGVPAVRAVRLRSRARREARELVVAIDLVLDSEVDLSALDDAPLLAYLCRLDHLAMRTTAAQVRVAAAAAAAYRGLEVFLGRYLPDPEAAGVTAQELTTGAIGTLSGTQTLALSGVAELAGARGLTAAVRESDGPAELLGAVAAHHDAVELIAEWQQVLARSGSAQVYGGPTWAEDPAGAWSTLQGALRREQRPAPARPETQLADIEAQITGTAKWRLQRVMTGQIVDVRRRMLRRLVDDAVTLLELRELSKGGLLRLGGEARRVHLEMARRLVERDLLADECDVELLSRRELDSAFDANAPAAGGCAPPGATTLTRRRAALDVANASSPLPQTFEGRPSAGVPTDAVGGVFAGWGASKGTYEGPARVVTNPKGSGLQAGDVLVAHTTDPSWTPLFLKAGAIVVEEGGPLSHAAIIARELGLPAVLNVSGIADAVRDGDLVTVDGSGSVRVHESDPEPHSTSSTDAAA